MRATTSWARFEVYKEKGRGFVEPAYQECLEIELGLQGTRFVAQGELEWTYKGRQLRQTFRSDFVCFGRIIVDVRYRLYAAAQDFSPGAYANLVRLKEPPLDLFERLKGP